MSVSTISSNYSCHEWEHKDWTNWNIVVLLVENRSIISTNQNKHIIHLTTDRAIVTAALLLQNTLPQQLRQKSTPTEFKSTLKTHLFKVALSWSLWRNVKLLFYKVGEFCYQYFSNNLNVNCVLFLSRRGIAFSAYHIFGVLTYVTCNRQKCDRAKMRHPFYVFTLCVHIMFLGFNGNSLENHHMFRCCLRVVYFIYYY